MNDTMEKLFEMTKENPVRKCPDCGGRRIAGVSVGTEVSAQNYSEWCVDCKKKVESVEVPPE